VYDYCDVNPVKITVYSNEDDKLQTAYVNSVRTEGNTRWCVKNPNINPYPANVENTVSFLIMPADGR